MGIFNKLFDNKDWDIKINLKCYDSKSTEMCDLQVQKQCHANRLGPSDKNGACGTGLTTRVAGQSLAVRFVLKWKTREAA